MKPGKFDLSKLSVGEKANVDVYEAGTAGELHVMHYVTGDGYPSMLTHWYPSADDIRRMINGKPIALHIVGSRPPWTKVEVPE